MSVLKYWDGLHWTKVQDSIGVNSYNGRTGAVTPVTDDVTGALGYTPADVQVVDRLKKTITPTYADDDKGRYLPESGIPSMGSRYAVCQPINVIPGAALHLEGFSASTPRAVCGYKSDGSVVVLAKETTETTLDCIVPDGVYTIRACTAYNSATQTVTGVISGWYMGGTYATEAAVSGLNADIAELQTDKQDKLTAGENITIVDNVISATGGGGGSTVKKFELIETVTFAEDATTFTRSAEPNGTAYKFQRMKIVFESNGTSSGNTDMGWFTINNDTYYLNLSAMPTSNYAICVIRFGADEYGDVSASLSVGDTGLTSYNNTAPNYRVCGKLEIVTGTFVVTKIRWYNSHFKAGHTVKIYGVRA